MDQPPVRYVDDLELGDELPPISFRPSLRDVVQFCRMWDNPGPNRFTDPALAKADGVSGAIVPGPMSAGFITQVFTRWAGNVRIRKLDVVFRQFIVQDRPLEVRAVVTDKDEAAGRVICDVSLQTAQGQRLVGGQVVLELPSRGGETRDLRGVGGGLPA